VNYVVAGYTIAYSVLALYVGGLLVRRRRLGRAVAVARRDAPPPGAAPGTRDPS
jgi:uncharacterized protein (TIGR03382 family)